MAFNIQFCGFVPLSTDTHRAQQVFAVDQCKSFIYQLMLIEMFEMERFLQEEFFFAVI